LNPVLPLCYRLSLLSPLFSSYTYIYTALLLYSYSINSVPHVPHTLYVTKIRDKRQPHTHGIARGQFWKLLERCEDEKDRLVEQGGIYTRGCPHTPAETNRHVPGRENFGTAHAFRHSGFRKTMILRTTSSQHTWKRWKRWQPVLLLVEKQKSGQTHCFSAALFCSSKSYCERRDICLVLCVFEERPEAADMKTVHCRFWCIMFVRKSLRREKGGPTERFIYPPEWRGT
jgi:hypothetical protein